MDFGTNKQLASIAHKIRYVETLDYCDGVQLFAAADADDGDYVAALVGVGKEADQYLVVGCHPESLAMFRSGAIDLQRLMSESAQQGWYLADVTDFGESFGIGRQPGTVIPDKLLPGTGICLDEMPPDDKIAAAV